jgi:hypothetical protein
VVLRTGARWVEVNPLGILQDSWLLHPGSAFGMPHMTRRKCSECGQFVCDAHRKQVQTQDGQPLVFLCLDDFERMSLQYKLAGNSISEVPPYWRVIDGEREPYR